MIRRVLKVERVLRVNCLLHGRHINCLPRHAVSTLQTRSLTATRKRTTLYLASRQPPWPGQRRGLFEGMVTFLNSHVHPVFFPPALFVALLLTLWVQKCIMMVVFQNKIIYMPGLPPDSRQEKLEDYQRMCRPVVWSEEIITSIDSKRLALCVGHIERQANRNNDMKKILILYFQG